MTTSFPYDVTYQPAAPVALIGVSPSGETESRQQIMAFLDSGADATMLPIDLLIAAEARYVEQGRMRGVIGDGAVVNMYLTAIHLDGQPVHGIRVVALPVGSEAIVGRDVLNQFEITLNGPAHETWIV